MSKLSRRKNLKPGIAAAKAVAQKAKSRTQLDDLELRSLSDKMAHETKLREDQLAWLRDERTLQKNFGYSVFYYLIAYSIAAFILLVFAGFKLWNFQLSDLVITTIVGSTAVSAIGLVGIAVQGVFNSKRIAALDKTYASDGSKS